MNLTGCFAGTVFIVSEYVVEVARVRGGGGTLVQVFPPGEGPGGGDLVQVSPPGGGSGLSCT